MAVLDRERNVVVLRIVYDGPASAGKTTSVRTLAARLGREATTPESAGERTLYFDWLDYTGGLFEGYQLRCQIVSVPGQAMLAHRRAYLLGTADSVVYVDTLRPEFIEHTLSRLSDIQTLARSNGRTLGVVLQANKRDLDGALPILEVQDALASSGLRVGLVESVATNGTGIRESFVFAVRLALDRVREQIRQGTLESAKPEVDDAAALLARMRTLETTPALEGDHIPRTVAASVEAPQASPAGQVLDSVLREEHAAYSHTPPTRESRGPIALGGRPPMAPDAAVPSGLIWPPIDGRLHLADAIAQPPSLSMAQGGWRASTERGWRFFSPLFAVYDDSEDGRGSLVHSARIHAAHSTVLSGPRCVVLARDGDDRWRLWQIVRERVSLRERLAACLDESDASRVAAQFVDAARRLIDLDARLESIPGSPLRATLDTTGLFAGTTQYVAVVPDRGPENGERPRLVIEDEFRPIVGDWRTRRTELILALKHGQPESQLDHSVRRRLAALLEG